MQQRRKYRAQYFSRGAAGVCWVSCSATEPASAPLTYRSVSWPAGRDATRRSFSCQENR